MHADKVPFSLDISRLRAAHAAGLTPGQMIDAMGPALADSDGLGVWITRVPLATLHARAAELRGHEDLPLFAIPSP